LMPAKPSFAQGTRVRMRDQRLALDQLGLALRNLRPNSILMPALGAVICVMYSKWLPLPKLLEWLGLLTVSSIPLSVVSFRFREVEASLKDSGERIAITAGLYFLFSLSWASMAYFLWVPGNDLSQLIIIMLLACTIAGNSALVGACLPLLSTCLGVYGASAILAALHAGGLIFNGVAVLAVLYCGYIAYMAHQIHLTARSMLLLRYEKNDLIAELAGAKEESDTARDQALAANRAKSQFLANMSHELRTPLNAILGFSEMITSRVFDAKPEKHYEYAGLIHNSGDHLLTLINDILDLAKIESGNWTLYESDVSLSALIAEVCGMLAPRAAAAGSTLKSEIDPRLPHIRCDERAIKQVLLNLMSNAVKFTPQGGLITIFAQYLTGGGVCFGVRDNGMGIAKEDQVRVFENFGQGRHDVATIDKGTGLGLPIVKGLVEAHGALLSLESELGEGTTVTVTLPADRTVPLAWQVAS
jgi:two-component system cell cycle sensor histidine kinase PleC